MHPQQQWQQQFPTPMPPRRRGPGLGVVLAIAAGGVLVLVVLAVLAIAVLGQRAGQYALDPTPAARAVPTPDTAERAAYLDTLALIDPGLAVSEERAIRRAGRVCERIVNPPKGGKLTLEGYVVEELSGGNATIDETQARQVIAAVRAWCR